MNCKLPQLLLRGGILGIQIGVCFLGGAHFALAERAPDPRIEPRLQPAISQGPPGDPLEVVSPEILRGTVAYATHQFAQSSTGEEHYFLTLRGISVASGSPSGVRTQEVKVLLKVFDPRLSPDGKDVLVKVGQFGDRWDAYSLYLWEPTTGKMQRLNIQPYGSTVFTTVLWSPDGRYLSYIVGGDAEGVVEGHDEDLKRFTYDIKTGQSHFIVQNNAAKIANWTNQNTLLYTIDPPLRDATSAPPDGPGVSGSLRPEPVGQHRPPQRPSIYESAPDGSWNRLLIHNGSGPNPSPDGKWVMFDGWEDPGEGQASPSGGSVLPSGPPHDGVHPAPPGVRPLTGRELRLQQERNRSHWYLYNRETHRRTRIPLPEEDSQSRFESFFQWMLDSQRLLLLQNTYYQDGTSQSNLSSLDIRALSLTKVATLHARDDKAAAGMPNQPQFLMNDFSHDGRFLLVTFSQALKVYGDGTFQRGETMEAVDLQNGKIFTVLKFAGVWGWDWHDETGATSATISDSGP